MQGRPLRSSKLSLSSCVKCQFKEGQLAKAFQAGQVQVRGVRVWIVVRQTAALNSQVRAALWHTAELILAYNPQAQIRIVIPVHKVHVLERNKAQICLLSGIPCEVGAL